MQNLFNLISQKRFLFLSFGGVLICMFGFLALENELGLPILDVLPHYDLDAVEQSMIGYGEEGRKLYAWASLTLDVLFPICYSCFFGGFMVLFGGLSPFRWLALFPFGLGFIDLVENMQICYMLLQYPNITESQVSVASTTTSLKHAMVIIVYSLVALLAIYAFIKWTKVRFKGD